MPIDNQARCYIQNQNRSGLIAQANVFSESMLKHADSRQPGVLTDKEL